MIKFLKNLFSSKPVEAAVVMHDGYRIVDAPMRNGSKFRMSARIEMDVDGDTKVHHLIRADTFDSQEAAADAAVTKAKQVIHEQGKNLFR